jgi:transcriptional regulator GlxA family with amidase domain
MPLFERMPPHRVAILALPGVVAFDLSVPTQVFGHRVERRRYTTTVCSVEAGPVPTSTGFSLVAEAGLEALDDANTIVVPGIDPTDGPFPEPLLDALRRSDARLVSICTGAFVLAAAGVLDGHRATTHWYDAPRLAERHPEIDVDPGVLYVDEGPVLTSAGVAAGIDLCLHIVRLDHGADAANAVARRMVVAPHRGGGQAQFVDRPLPRPVDDSLESTRAWALERLDQPLTVAALARTALMSERSFLRRFRAETGTSPLRWLLDQRVAHARRLLEATDLPVEEVAARCGLGTAANLRRHFARATRTTPTAYRRAFRGR